MKLDHLVAHGFSQRTIENWKRFRDPELLPLQAHAVAHTGLLRGESLAVFAPTSSGKTFVGELAALHHVERGGRALFLVPTKALAEEHAAYLSSAYAPLSLNVRISTADRRKDDEALARGHFHLAVVVYEKLRALLTGFPEIAGLVSCVVADELQILGDRERGWAADLLITKLLSLPHPPQMVAMSAVLEDHDRLASWLGASPLVWHERPVELREGVLDLSTGIFRYREWNSRREQSETLTAPLPAGSFLEWRSSRHANAVPPEVVEGLVRLAHELVVKRGEQLLVFVPTKALSREIAAHIARALPPSDSSLIEEDCFHHLAESSAQNEMLANVLSHGVGFHNADLSTAVRRAMEQAFNCGKLRVIVATSTLAQGVNLGCRNVVSLPLMVVQGDVANRPVAVPLSPSRLRNQGGRAGRYRRACPYGRSIVLARDEAEAERLFQVLLQSPVEPLAASMDLESMAIATLDYLVLRQGWADAHALTAPEATEIENFLSRTFASRMMNRPTISTLAQGALQLLVAEELVEQHADRFTPTGMGEVAATFGLTPTTAAHLRTYLGSFAEHTPKDELPFLLAAATSPQGAAFPLSATPWEIRTGKYLHFYHDYWCEHEADASTLPFQLPGGGASAADHAALKKTFLAHAWISSRPTRSIEEAFGILSGTIESLGQHFAWLVEAMAALAARLGLGDDIREKATVLAERLRLGVPASALALAREFHEILPRTHLIALASEGLDTPAALTEASDEVLIRIVPAPFVRALRMKLDGQAHDEVVNSLPEDPGTREETSSVNGINQEDLAQGTECSGDKRALMRSHPASARADFVAPAAFPQDIGVASDRPAPRIGRTPEDRTRISGMPSTTEAQEDSLPLIELDRRSPGVVRVNGVQMFLSVLPYRLLSYLAHHSGRVVPYEELDAELWPDAKVEQQQILAHKATIVRHLSEIVGPAVARKVLRTVAGHGLYLHAGAVRIRPTN